MPNEFVTLPRSTLNLAKVNTKPCQGLVILSYLSFEHDIQFIQNVKDQYSPIQNIEECPSNSQRCQGRY